MQKTYRVDSAKRKAIIRQKKLEKKEELASGRRAAGAVYALGALVFFVPLAIAVPGIIEKLAEGAAMRAVAYGAAIVLAFLAASLLWNIPRGMRIRAERNHLWKWTGRSEEYVLLREDAIRWYYYSRHDMCFVDYTLKYSDIDHMIYNATDGVLCVYGQIEEIRLDGSRRAALAETTEKERSITEMPWMTFASYLENFEELMEKLEAASGKKIIRCAK